MQKKRFTASIDDETIDLILVDQNSKKVTFRRAPNGRRFAVTAENLESWRISHNLQPAEEGLDLFTEQE